jgi:hypothetical protein
MFQNELSKLGRKQKEIEVNKYCYNNKIHLNLHTNDVQFLGIYVERNYVTECVSEGERDMRKKRIRGGKEYA